MLAAPHMGSSFGGFGAVLDGVRVDNESLEAAQDEVTDPERARRRFDVLVWHIEAARARHQQHEGQGEQRGGAGEDLGMALVLLRGLCNPNVSERESLAALDPKLRGFAPIILGGGESGESVVVSAVHREEGEMALKISTGAAYDRIMPPAALRRQRLMSQTPPMCEWGAVHQEFIFPMDPHSPVCAPMFLGGGDNVVLVGISTAGKWERAVKIYTTHKDDQVGRIEIFRSATFQGMVAMTSPYVVPAGAAVITGHHVCIAFPMARNDAVYGGVHRGVSLDHLLLFEASLRAGCFLMPSLSGFRHYIRSGDWIGRMGNVEYSPPEVLRMKRGQPYSQKVDIFAFGVLVFRLVFGITPYAALGKEAFLHVFSSEVRIGAFVQDNINLHEKDKGVHVSEYLRAIMMVCLDRDPSSRSRPPLLINDPFFQKHFLGVEHTGPSPGSEAYDILRVRTPSPCPLPGNPFFQPVQDIDTQDRAVAPAAASAGSHQYRASTAK
ncbi:unnamed protein product [Vitrella brassicaformis CCMP3155]|uniref:Protein kinase domain-containing protein n=1 Tax=Vitrella brassicaformis (strain CCMP3155) TaxID=1169540 RepID=A0A0G4FDT6_VITBC|nr:unnamed protein product [Vitrella brassicaformis CCMP3155]|eukprot:CEM11029.1 unnamed protein product [Vitrella brassicaformis CCMP3155]